MKSILQKEKYCYICKRIGQGYAGPLEEHHIFEGSRRKNSEKYGLKVWLCPDHHQFGLDAVHKLPNEGWDLFLKQTAETRFTEEHPVLDFRSIFGKSYQGGAKE